ncbi:hypothetical protein TNCV_3015401 [Trichonephila clavipes]|nr:hypothetical protein TNCV_3015401 [Trichonephila clavipes]
MVIFLNRTLDEANRYMIDAEAFEEMSIGDNDVGLLFPFITIYSLTRLLQLTCWRVSMALSRIPAPLWDDVRLCPILRSFSRAKKSGLSAVAVRAMISISSAKANNCIDLLKIFSLVMIFESLTTFSNARLKRKLASERRFLFPMGPKDHSAP